MICYQLFDKSKFVIEVGDKTSATRKHGLNSTRERILSEMRHNLNITKLSYSF